MQGVKSTSAKVLSNEVAKGWMYRLFRQINHQQQTAEFVVHPPRQIPPIVNLELNSSEAPEYALFRC